jgi:trehalose synthase-fused probable maltokinase
MLEEWADSMTADLDALLAGDSKTLDPLRAIRPAIIERFDSLRELQPEGLCIRIHGDLHLGQVLRVSAGWVVLDFEGEPDRSPAERRERSSPLRDVAGMLRSFDYAAAVALTERARPDSDEWEELMTYGDAWAQSNRDAFWSAYLETLGPHPMLPSPSSVMVIRRAFEVHKAVYEVGYELGHRPSWARIPLRFLLRAVA